MKIPIKLIFIVILDMHQIFSLFSKFYNLELTLPYGLRVKKKIGKSRVRIKLFKVILESCEDYRRAPKIAGYDLPKA